MKESLKIRKELKSRKPNFVRGDFNKEKSKTRSKWKRPRGLHNKRRLKRKGHQKNPSVGFKSPKEVRNLTKNGLKPIHIYNINDLNKIKDNTYLPIISSKVGLKNKLEILEKCLSNGIAVSAIKDIKKFIEESKNKLKDKKEVSRTRIEKKKKEAEDLAKKKKEAEDLAKKKKDSSKDKQKKVEKEVLGSKQKKEKALEKNLIKKDTTQSKGGHQASNVPGTKQ